MRKDKLCTWSVWGSCLGVSSFYCHSDALAFCKALTMNTSNSMSDQDKISPYSIGTIWRRQVMRIKKNTYQGIIIWSNTKFSKVTLWKNCLSGRMENCYWDLGSERVNWKFECCGTKEEPIHEFRVYWSLIDIGCNFLVSLCALISLIWTYRTFPYYMTELFCLHDFVSFIEASLALTFFTL